MLKLGEDYTIFLVKSSSQLYKWLPVDDKICSIAHKFIAIKRFTPTVSNQAGLYLKPSLEFARLLRPTII